MALFFHGIGVLCGSLMREEYLKIFFADMNSNYSSYEMKVCRETLGEGRQETYLLFASSCASCASYPAESIFELNH